LIEVDDPPGVDQLCACSHIDRAESLHCLQSLERSSASQGEGIAHFYASKLWNLPDQSECRFNYYKNLLDISCPAGAECSPFDGRQLVRPPLPVSCKQSVKWRNQHCEGRAISSDEAPAQMGTEYDWLGFLWNVHTSAENASTMDDLYSIYQHACGEPAGPAKECSNSTVRWERCTDSGCSPSTLGVREGVERHFGADDPHAALVRDLGNQFGVNTNTAL
jgi:hypothetical protein